MPPSKDLVPVDAAPGSDGDAVSAAAQPLR